MATTPTTTTTNNNNEIDTLSCGLPSFIKPLHYNITWVPNLETNEFQGYLRTHIVVTKATSSITLNAHQLTIREKNDGQLHVSLYPISSSSTDINKCKSLSNDTKEQRFTFEFEKEIAIGEYQLEILFSGILNSLLTGFYRSSYQKPSTLVPASTEITNNTNKDTSVSRMAVTQMEATGARQALPCWDEPACKATFEVSLIVPSYYKAISNMPVSACSTTSKADGTPSSHWLVYPAGYHHFQFATTPKMSTYLLAMIVGEFDYISATTTNHVEIRLYAPIGKSHLGNFALDVAVRCLAYYEQLFNIRYPLPKMDLIAVPDFAFGAMENWGAITYREILLLIDPETSGQDIKTRVALTVCHELAHMWFGNLVSMEWWSYLWLNESFAHWIEHAACNHLFPEWNIWDSFVSDVNGRALSLDAMESSHPIEVPVAHPDQIGEIFDAISYAKGASVVRMLSETLGFEQFIKGIQCYLNHHAYGNTKSADLWTALEETSKKDVRRIMSNWLGQMGYPLIVASEDSHPSSNDRVINLKQQQYFADMQNVPNIKRSWIVPITVSAYKNGKLIGTAQSLLEGETGTITLSNPSFKDAALKFNHNQVGFYRVQYSAVLMDSLKPDIPSLQSSDRIGILRDTFALASAGVIDITVALELLSTSYSHEPNFNVINSASGDLISLFSLHQGKEYYPRLQRIVRKLFQYNYERLGWEKKHSETSRDGLLRALVITMLGITDDETVIAEAMKRFNMYIQNSMAHPIDGDLRRPIYGIAAKKGGLTARVALVKLYENTSSQEERVRILGSLGKLDGMHKDDAESTRINVDWCFSDHVRSSDVPYLIQSIAGSALGRNEVWKFFNAHWDQITSRYGGTSNMLLQSVLSGGLSSFQSNEAADDIEKFFQSHPVPTAQLTVRQIIERVRHNARRVAREEPILKQWCITNPQ